MRPEPVTTRKVISSLVKRWQRRSKNRKLGEVWGLAFRTTRPMLSGHE